MKERTISLVVTLLFHAILLLLLFVLYIKPVDRNQYDDELGGVPVMFGNAENALGDAEPSGSGNGLQADLFEIEEPDITQPNHFDSEAESSTEEMIASKSAEITPPRWKQSEVPIATQNTEETLALKEPPKVTPSEAELRRKAEAKIKAREEAEKKVKAEEEKKNNINNKLAGLFGKGEGNGSRGKTQGTGTQGSPSGNSDEGKLSGIAGLGSYDLGGRGVGEGGLQLPSYNVNDYGTVVVDIIVDPKGNVIDVAIGKGTNTANPTLRSESLRAAQRTKFSRANHDENQKGTITYRFNLN